MTSPQEEGDPTSKLLVLAQAPSYAEVRMGQPLVGPSGEVFNECLHAAGLIRRELYILNVWPYQVTKQGENLLDPSGKLLWDYKRGLTEHGISEAASTLEKIRLSHSNMILTLGAQAMELAIGRKVPMLKWRGSILPGHNRVSGRKIIPTIHPAATIHGTYLWRYLIIADMEKAREERHSFALNLPERNLIIGPSFSDAMEYIRSCHFQPRVATDLEVINHQVSCFSLSYDPKEAMTVPLTNQEGGHYWSEDQEIDIWRAYGGLMEDVAVDKINQNIVGFDAPFLVAQNNIYTKGFLGDTMIAQHIMYPEFNKGLDFITSLRTREPYYKDEGKMWKGYGGPIEEFWRYNGKDAVVALEAWDDLAQEMTEGGFWDTYYMTVNLANALIYMTIRGFKVDMEKLAITKTRVEGEIAGRRAELTAVAEWDFNPRSPKQCNQYFYVTKGIKPYIGATGNPTTDDKALARIYRRYNLREAKLVQEIRTLEKLHGTYLEIQFDADKRLRCAWNPRGTWTGRLSSGKTIFGTGANMQNIHEEFREFLVADQEEAP